MIRKRPDIEYATTTVCERVGFLVKRIPGEHAGGKWRLQYNSVLGIGGSLEIDVNFLLCVPLWNPQTIDSKPIGSIKSLKTKLFDIHELAAGKIAALLSRNTCRDLFNTRGLFSQTNLDFTKL